MRPTMAKRSDRITAEDLDLARAWLECHDDEGDAESAACRKVAKMLERMANERDDRASARTLSRKYGKKVTPAQVRDMMQRRNG